MRDHLNNKSVQDGIVVFGLGLALGVFSVYSFTHAAVKAAWIMSPYLFPMLISCFAMGLGVCLFVEGRHQVNEERSAEARSAAAEKAALKRVFRVAEMSVAYYFLLPVLSFVPATALFLYALMSFFGEERCRVKLLLAILVPLALYLVFSVGLSVRLP